MHFKDKKISRKNIYNLLERIYLQMLIIRFFLYTKLILKVDRSIFHRIRKSFINTQVQYDNTKSQKNNFCLRTAQILVSRNFLININLIKKKIEKIMEKNLELRK